MATRYNPNGVEYRDAEVKEGEALVFRQIEDDDIGMCDGELLIVNESKLHASPPKGKIDGQIAELQKERARLLEEIRTLVQQMDAFEKDADGRMARLTQHNALKRLDDFLAGRITHYVMVRHGPPAIVAFEDAVTEEGCRRPAFKLLTLFGGPNCTLEWQLNQYSDGSGWNGTAIPCTSHADAVEVVTKLFAEQHVPKALALGSCVQPQRLWLDRAAEYHITLDPRYKERVEDAETMTRSTKIRKLKAELETLRSPC